MAVFPVATPNVTNRSGKGSEFMIEEEVQLNFSKEGYDLIDPKYGS